MRPLPLSRPALVAAFVGVFASGAGAGAPAPPYLAPAPVPTAEEEPTSPQTRTVDFAGGGPGRTAPPAYQGAPGTPGRPSVAGGQPLCSPAHPRGRSCGCPDCRRRRIRSRGTHDGPDLDDRCVWQVPPAGAAIDAIFAGQIARADASQMALYEYDFLPEAAALSPRGQYQLRKILRRAARTPFPVVIQAFPGRQDLDAARLDFVLTEAAYSGHPIPPERVLIGPPPSRGLDGADAVLVHERLLNLTAAGGAAAAAGAPARIAAPPLSAVP